MNAFKFSTFIQLLTHELQTLKPACEGDLLTFSDTTLWLIYVKAPLPSSLQGIRKDKMEIDF